MPSMAGPAYTRLQVDERRRQLLERATALFAQHGYDELSMARIAREAGISKALLYHYFPSKRDLFEAALGQAAEEHLARVGGEAAPAVRTAVRAWLWYMDGVCLDWVREGDLSRDEVRALLLGTLDGALAAAGLER